ncbi:PfkB family carbohydrate kinase [Patulibacter defluvii]|uniref:PfkB family carbohydrate kinase n=1 Tax=Patulibacter defluvii TaxID=3095358 RepID=UPI002A75F1B4|nr:PfkB family carbohydrate kinase [Patulibacter sp. DM4]
MSITVVGSIAYDTVTTPFGRRERMLGGAATHFALAASLFDEVHVVGSVGGDFRAEDRAILGTRGSHLDDVDVIPDGKTFAWAGEYGWDLNRRETLDTQLNVFERFAPRLGPAARACDVLFLANIQPSLQLSVLGQCDRPRWVAVDSMDLWIDVARPDLLRVIERVDCVVLNDAEVRQLTGHPTTVGGARELLDWGPTAVVAKQGEYGAILVTGEGTFSLPSYPLEVVVDPTGAGDTFAGGLVGHLAANAGRPIDHELLSTAIAYGTATASFNVEEFGTERVSRLTLDEVQARVDDLHRMTQFRQPEPFTP